MNDLLLTDESFLHFSASYQMVMNGLTNIKYIKYKFPKNFPNGGPFLFGLIQKWFVQAAI